MADFLVAHQKKSEPQEVGWTWLISTLLNGGSLATYNDYMPEPFVGQVYSGVNAEALRLLSVVCAANQDQNR